MPDFNAKMHQNRFRLGLRPRPRWGSLQRSPRPPSWIKGGLLLRGREGREGKGREGERGREGEGRVGWRAPLCEILNTSLYTSDLFTGVYPWLTVDVNGVSVYTAIENLMFLICAHCVLALISMMKDTSVVVKTFFKSRDQDRDLGLQVSRPRPRHGQNELECT